MSDVAVLPKTDPAVRFKLFVMMIIELFVWGAWQPMVYEYMGLVGFSPAQQQLAGSVFGIASIIGIFFSNQFADRNFSAERFLALSHLIGGLCLLGASYAGQLAKDSAFTVFFACFLLYAILYVPTLSVTNALAFARLILAVLVIVSHSPELIDGNPDREFLKSCFGTLTIGQVAVHGFFFISGFLIVDSAVRRAPLEFLTKRVLRIVPGFVVAYLVSITLVFWLAGGEFTELSAEKWVAKISKVALLLNPAQVGSAFAGTPAPDVNGSLWTIAYEFRCYLLALAVVLVFGRSGLPFLLLAAALSLTLLFSLSTGARWQFDTGNYEPIGNVDDAVRFTLAFASGAASQLFKHRIPSNGTLALTSLALLAIGMLWAETASIAVSIFGGYLLLYLAFAAAGSFWSNLNRKNDISYGIYLYAWPIQKLGILFLPAIAPIQLTALTIPLAAGAGLMSWHLVEKHALRWRLPDRFSAGNRSSREDEMGAAPIETPATPQPARVRGRRYA